MAPGPVRAISYEDVLILEQGRTRIYDGQTVQALGATFKKYRHFAPQATLRFRFVDKSTGRQPWRLWLQPRDGQSDGQSEVQVAADGRFSLPAYAFAQGAALYTNLPWRYFEIYPEVLSPGSNFTRRRLGDLRLQCRLYWAIYGQHPAPELRRAFAPQGGTCTSDIMPVSFYSPHPLTRAHVMRAGQALPLAIRNRHFYVAPLADKKISDEAVIEIN